jgi:hypothetical protein
MSDFQESTIPTLEVLIYHDGAIVQRELCESEDEASAIVDSWADREGVVCQVEDLRRSADPGVLEPRSWEVDAVEDLYETSAWDEDEGPG